MHYLTQNDGSLFDHLIAAFPDSSRSTIRSWTAHGRIHVNGRRVKRTDTPVSKGSLIELQAKPLPHEGPLRIHYEDRHIIVVEKPSGLLSVAKETGEEVSAHAWIKHRFPGRVIPVVHRLDQDTSGLMVFGLTDTAFHGLKTELQQGGIKRIYRALVEGRLEAPTTWEGYLIEDRSLKMHVAPKSTKGAERAVTHVTPLRVGEVYTLIDCELETGKKNQIRVQAAHAGHPIAGDTKYGSRRKDAYRLCLHARLLSFHHPITKEKMLFESPPPPFFDRLALRKRPLEQVQKRFSTPIPQKTPKP